MPVVVAYLLDTHLNLARSRPGEPREKPHTSSTSHLGCLSLRKRVEPTMRANCPPVTSRTRSVTRAESRMIRCRTDDLSSVYPLIERKISLFKRRIIFVELFLFFFFFFLIRECIKKFVKKNSLRWKGGLKMKDRFIKAEFFFFFFFFYFLSFRSFFFFFFCK